MKLLNTNSKEKILKAVREKKTCYVNSNKFRNDGRYHVRNHRSEKTALRKKIVNLKFY